MQRIERVADFHLGEDAHRLQCLRPGAVHDQFVGQQAAVEREGALERVELFVRLALEAPTPEAVVFAFGNGLIGHGHGCVTLLAEMGAGVQRPCGLLVLARFCLCFRAHRYREREKIDEAFGIFGVVTAHREAGQIGSIEREGRLAASDVERALPKF